MAKKKKLTEANKKKLINAGETLKNFATSSAVENILNVTDIYDVNNAGTLVTFDLVFLTKGVGAITTAVLHDAITSVDLPIATDERDSLIKHPIKIDSVVNRKFLKMVAKVAATNLTPVPADLKVNFILSGGASDKNIPIPPASFKEVGDQVIIDFSIFFF